MSIAEKLLTIAENEQKVYDAGHSKGYNEGYEHGYNDGYTYGHEDGIKSEYDRFWDNFQNYGNRTDYRYAFGTIFNPDTLKPKYTIKPKDAYAYNESQYYLFTYTNANGKLIDASDIVIDLSEKGKVGGMWTANNIFSNAAMDNITIDVSMCTSTTRLFSYPDSNENSKPATVSIKVSEKTGFSNTFYYMQNLKNLTFMEGSVIGKNGLDLTMSTKLTHESLMSVINALKDYSEDTSGTTWKVTLGSTNLAKLTEDELNMITAKGWTYA